MRKHDIRHGKFSFTSESLAFLLSSSFVLIGGYKQNKLNPVYFCIEAYFKLSICTSEIKKCLYLLRNLKISS